ncbi:MAG: amidohydrolase family protein [Gemmatimonadales bacterium]
MRRAPALVLAILCGGVFLPAVAQQADTTRMALTGGNVLDQRGATWLTNTTVLIRGETIEAVYPAGSRALPMGTRMVDVTGRFLIPGLIDTHVHLATVPDSEDAPPRAAARLRAALYGGVTSVRDMAGDARRLAGLARDAQVGSIESPYIYYSALFAGPAFFRDPRTLSSSRGAVAGQVPWMRAVTDTTNLPLAVAQAKGTGATAIKLYAALDSATVARITAEAHRQRLLVWSHAALRPATPAQVVAGGVDAVSHASLLATAMSPDEMKTMREDAEAGRPVRVESATLDRVLAAMAARGTVFDPTLYVYSDNPALQRAMGLLARRARTAGVAVSTGTDSIISQFDGLPNVHQEMELLVTLAGFSPSAALIAATRNGARTLGLEDSVGTIAPGRRADLVVLRADPLADIRNSRQIDFVVKGGRIYRRP